MLYRVYILVLFAHMSTNAEPKGSASVADGLRYQRKMDGGLMKPDSGMIPGILRLRGLHGKVDTVPCDPLSQLLGLVSFFKATGGAQWTNSSGWPTDTLRDSSLPPLETGACQDPGSGSVLPDHCW